MHYDRSSSALYKLLQTGKKLMLPKGQVVHAFEDRAMLNLIASGYVKRYLINDEGNKSIQQIYGPGDIFPLTPVYKSLFMYDMYSGTEEYYYESISPIEAYSISQAELEQAVKKEPGLYGDLFFAAGLRLDAYIHRLEALSERSAKQALAAQLVYFARVYGEQTEHGIKINLPLTHQTLAEVLNLARETVSHVLADLQKEKLVSGSGSLLIRDLEALDSIC